MWKTTIKLKHKCLFGDNCEKSRVSCVNISFNSFKKGNFYYVYHFGTVFGENSKKFINSLKKDRRVDYIETQGRTFFIVEKRKAKEVPGMYIGHDIIYTKPVYVDNTGHETWSLAAIKKETLMEFIKKFKDARILSIQTSKLTDIYSLRLSPDLTQHQRDAFELAKNQGYYLFPKKTDLNKLAKIAKLSKSAFREHLKRAEMKILGETSY
ncbi:helix-turn-helix domain-containing protein [Candidatus Woesearchaeota archaeon]|nr:helix-turn-helix domain-containing protein [Candidatus Woesearchaeota archaeon]